MVSKEPKIVAIVGPTASGKTALSLFLAGQFSGEIISADSRQVYRKLDIGTAKITKAEMGTIPHHLIDVVDINETFSAHDFATQATSVIDSIHSRANLPIIVGGTFFYLDQLRGRAGKAPVPPNPALRSELENLSLEELKARVANHDTSLLSKIDTQNPRRLMRAIEILEALGYLPEATRSESKYEWLIIGLSTPKEALRQRYEERARAWLSNGFLEEIKGLLEQGITRLRLNEIGFEYSLGLSLLDGHITEAEFTQKFIEKNWQYAKRQMTWLKRDKEIRWFEPADTDTIFSTVKHFLQD